MSSRWAPNQARPSIVGSSCCSVKTPEFGVADAGCRVMAAPSAGVLSARSLADQRVGHPVTATPDNPRPRASAGSRTGSASPRRLRSDSVSVCCSSRAKRPVTEKPEMARRQVGWRSPMAVQRRGEGLRSNASRAAGAIDLRLHRRIRPMAPSTVVTQTQPRTVRTHLPYAFPACRCARSPSCPIGLVFAA